MRNFKGNINLMQLVGAKVVSMEVNGKSMNCVCIPAAWNDIYLSADKATNEPNGAYLNIRAWGTGVKYRQVCEANNADKEGYIAPSHQISTSYSEQFQKDAVAAAENRLRKNEELMAKNLPEEEIKKKALYTVSNKSRIGTLTPLEPQQPEAYTGKAAPAQGISEWIPPMEDSEDSQSKDDLPF